MSTIVKEYDRSKFEGMKFAFILDQYHLCFETSPQKAIDWFIDRQGAEPKTCVQQSKYPTIS